jgi:hypothetical protein
MTLLLPYLEAFLEYKFADAVRSVFVRFRGPYTNDLLANLLMNDFC